MTLIMQLLVALGAGVVLYAVFGIFTSGDAEVSPKQKTPVQPFPVEDPGKEQKIQRLQSQIAKLESQLEESRISSVGEKSGFMETQQKEAEFSAELKRREEWVAKAETELAKIKSENSDLSNKFIAKEKELEDEFTKNVNLTRELREIKAALEAKEMACRLKEDQLQAQKHQIESQLNSINEGAATIAEFNRKEKISEWVPKSEFNQLNTEYTKLEKDFEASQEKLKSFAVEIAHLRQAQDKKVVQEEEQAAPQAALPEVIPQEPMPAQDKKEAAPIEVNPEETKTTETDVQPQTKEAEEQNN